MQVLGKLSEFNEVTLVWIPGHQRILGNEEADRLAKKGATEVPCNQFTTIPFSVSQKKKTGISTGGLPVLAADSPKC
jgi:ribonuclease HI